MATHAVDKFSRLRVKIQQKISNGEFYEAHQLYRTLHFRLCGHHKYEEATDLMMEGALELFKAKQMSSATDLALIVVELLDKSNALANSENIARVSKLHQLIAPGHIERPKFVGAAMRWSNKLSPPPSSPSATKQVSGSSILHGEFGITYWNEKDYVQARHHLVRSYEGEACAAMLIEYQITCGFPNEVDLFITQAVLQFLCLQNRNTAEICFNKYTSRHPQIESGPPYIRPLLNFLSLLLLAVERGNLTVFTVLCEQYDFSLKRDPSYHDYLTKIAQVFFNVPVPTQMNNFGGLFGNIMPELLRNDSDDEEKKFLPVELD